MGRKPLSVEKVWYNKEVEIRECNWSMVKSRKLRANDLTDIIT